MACTDIACECGPGHGAARVAIGDRPGGRTAGECLDVGNPGGGGGRLAHAVLSLNLGCAAGNALDRLIHGGVTDFLEVRLGTYRWPAFNVADSAISIGAALVLIELLFGGRHRSDSAERDRG